MRRKSLPPPDKQRAAPLLADRQTYPSPLSPLHPTGETVIFEPALMPVGLLGEGSRPIVTGGSSGWRPPRTGPLVSGSSLQTLQSEAGGAAGPRQPRNLSVRGLGCRPDVSDRRDFCLACFLKDHAKIPHPKALPPPPGKAARWLTLSPNEQAAKLPSRVHLGDGGHVFGPVVDQGSWNTCTACVVTAALMAQTRLQGKPSLPTLSRMFVYYGSRYLMGLRGDTGAYLRTAFKALAKFGSPGEEHWPYDPEELLNETPDAFTCQMASTNKPAGYFRLDEPRLSPEALAQRLKAALADGFPVGCGVSVVPSFGHCTAETGYSVALPSSSMDSEDRPIDSHALLLVGYDESAVWFHSDGQPKGRGAFIVRNSWGPRWGDYGYAFLPYPYVTEALALDFWMLVA